MVDFSTEGGGRMKAKKRRATPLRRIVLSFLGVIFAGSLLLMTPLSSAEGIWTPFVDCLFTATSATCVTGLAVVDTAGHWSVFGQAVLLLLIQIGGLGAMTIITGFFAVVRKRTSLSDTRMLMQAAGDDSYAGVAKMVRRLFTGTFLFEVAGAALLATRFIPEFGWGRGLWFSVFHSVSAFCNAGFDLMGDYKGGASLSAFATDPVVVFTIAALILIGGLGFIVWDDLLNVRFKLKNLKFHSKLVLVMSAVLVTAPFALFLLFENDAAFAGRSPGDKLLLAFFQTVTPRTAGFATVPMASLSDAGALLTMVLMLIGGSPGSTAGGVKTTTVAVLLICTASSVKKSAPVAFKRRIDDNTVRQATAIVVIYLSAVAAATCALCAVDAVTLRDALFEVISAIATVGLSTGITPTLGLAAKLILTALMFAGRIGGLTMAIAITGEQATPPVKYPSDKLLVG